MESGKIKTLFTDVEKTEALFPRTKVSAISDNNGVGLDALLNNINAEIDTKATEAFVANKIAEAQISGGGSGDIDLSGYATKDDVKNIDFPIDSVNGKTGAVTLSAADVGALPISGGTVTGNGDTPLYLKSSTVNAYVGFKNFSDKTLGYLGIAEDGTPIFYDTGVKTILHSGNIASFAAPSGYGLGAHGGMSVTDANTATKNGWYYVTGNSANNADPNDHVMLVLNYGSSAVHQIAFLGNAVSANIYIKIRKLTSSWQPWVWVNPFMDTNTEYLTLERLHSAPIYKKIDSKGVMLYREGTWGTWKPQDTVKVKLWENANISNAFNAQTISLDLSEYDGIEILYYVDSTTNIYQNTGFIRKSLPGIMYYVTSSTGNRVHRNFTVNSNGVKFETALSSAGANVSTLCKPYQIFGIKGVK